MSTRTVTGTILTPDGTAWAGAEISFWLKTSFETSTQVYPEKTHKETTDANGQFSTALGVPDTGAAHYVIGLPDGQSYTVYLAAGASVDLVTLITVAGTSESQDDLQTLLDAAAVFTIRSVSTTGNILATDEYVRASGTITLTLPAATGSGWAVAVKNVGSGVITVDGNGDETIDSSASVVLTAGTDNVFIDAVAGAWDTIGGYE